MKIPNSDWERDLFFSDLIQKCSASRDDRMRTYTELRNYYLFGGSDDDGETPYNKVFPHIDLLTSFLFSADTTKFSIKLGADVNKGEVPKVPVLSRAVHDEWLSSNADRVFSEGVQWSLVFNTMIVKLIVKGGQLQPFLVEPHCFGVLREDVPFLDRQEAFTHHYHTTQSQLTIDLANHPNKDSILSNLTGTVREMNTELSGLDRIIILNTQPNIQGNVNANLTDRNRYIPRVQEELLDMVELWVFDDDLNDYRTVTRCQNEVTIYDRKNIFIDGDHPFIQICPNPLYGYFWGSSEVDRLMGLQKWYNERIAQMRSLLNRQVAPPMAYTGMGIQDEKLAAFQRAGGYLSMAGDPMAKVQEFKPEIPTDLFREISMLNEMFSEQSGLQNLLQGKGESGVRSGRQTSELARLGSARVKKKSLAVEDSLEKIATLYLRFLQVYDKRQYVDQAGMMFAASQFTKSFVVRVDGHSNSPLFVEDHKALAGELFEAHAIDRARLVDMLDPPGKDEILNDLKGIEKKEAAAAQAKHQEELAMAASKKGGQPPLQQVK